MKDRRLLWGATASVAWICFAAYMLSSSKQPTELNAWGDFFAGFFAPLAFLWLVLGYLQQGEELRNSTKALQLQAQELRASVEQQSQLVAVTREQVQHEVQALQEERERRRDAARPKFVPQIESTTTSGGRATYQAKLVNVGNTATNVIFSLAPPIEGTSPIGATLVPRNGEIKFSLARPESLPTTVANVAYVDADGLPGQVRFPLSLEGARLAFGQVERVE